MQTIKEPRIELLPARKLMGMCLEMSFANDRTPELWRSFMPRRNEIKHVVLPYLFSVQIFDDAFSFYPIDVHAGFIKWAAREVTDTAEDVDGMNVLDLPGGLYASFHYQGTSAGFEPAFNFIFHEWLPHSGYELDKRPHFELLGEKYKNNDPFSEEDICIPIRKRG